MSSHFVGLFQILGACSRQCQRSLNMAEFGEKSSLHEQPLHSMSYLLNLIFKYSIVRVDVKYLCPSCYALQSSPKIFIHNNFFLSFWLLKLSTKHRLSCHIIELSHVGMDSDQLVYGSQSVLVIKYQFRGAKYFTHKLSEEIEALDPSHNKNRWLKFCLQQELQGAMLLRSFPPWGLSFSYSNIL